MDRKRPIEVYLLLICFIIGILADIYALSLPHVNLREKSVWQIFAVGFPSVLLICMSLLLFVKRKTSYIIIWLLYLPVAFCGWCFVFLSFYFLNIFTLLLPICGILTMFSLFSKSLKTYFLI